MDEKHELFFLDMEVFVDEQREDSFKWYQKPEDAGKILFFRSCVPLQYKRNIVEVTIHKLY